MIGPLATTPGNIKSTNRTNDTLMKLNQKKNSLPVNKNTAEQNTCTLLGFYKINVK